MSMVQIRSINTMFTAGTTGFGSEKSVIRPNIFAIKVQSPKRHTTNTKAETHANDNDKSTSQTAAVDARRQVESS